MPTATFSPRGKVRAMNPTLTTVPGAPKVAPHRGVTTPWQDRNDPYQTEVRTTVTTDLVPGDRPSMTRLQLVWPNKDKKLLTHGVDT